jgi:hypothetical protein
MNYPDLWRELQNRSREKIHGFYQQIQIEIVNSFRFATDRQALS